MWMKPHQWNMVPYTRYEIRREMRVRESTHTVMLFPRRYQDIDTGKYCTDKMETLYSESLANLSYSCNGTGYYVNAYAGYYNIPKFIPKDNDFDFE